KLLLAALGGEGGHVLAAWLNDAAIASGHYAQGTFIPGVAQRTGATTYYLEIVPGAATRHRAGDARPVLALNAAPGEVDIMIASEMLEATRAILAGFVTPERTTLIASTARVFTVDEKSAMTDGRLDGERMRQLAADTARRLILADFAAVAARSKSFVNAVLLGALAAAEVLPIALGAFRRQCVAADRTLAGFAAGRAAVADHARAPEPAPATPPLPPTDDAAGDVSEFPAEARSVLAAAVARLTDYQDAAYARRYLER